MEVTAFFTSRRPSPLISNINPFRWEDPARCLRPKLALMRSWMRQKNTTGVFLFYFCKWSVRTQAWHLTFLARLKFASRLYLASIHRDLTEEDIRSVFSAFGTIKDCDMAKYASIFKNNQHSCVKSRLEHFSVYLYIENKLKFSLRLIFLRYPPGMEQQKYNELHKNSASSGQRKYFPWWVVGS